MMLSSLRGRRANRSSMSRTFEPLEPRVLLSAGLIDLGRFTASDTVANDEFGRTLASSGGLVIVGSPFDDDAGLSSGAAYLFGRDGNAMTERGKLTASDGAANDQFGLALATDGDTIIIGAPRHDAGASDAGAAYVFVRDGDGWLQLAKLTAPDAAMGDQFGAAVGVSGDTIVVGSPFDDDGGSSSGSAYVFHRNDNGTPDDLTDDSWSSHAKLHAGDAMGGARFGATVGISGGTIVTGAPLAGGGSQVGGAYVFTRGDGGTPGDNSDDAWTQAAKLLPDTSFTGDTFGISVAVDGGTVAVGSERVNGSNAVPGGVWLFEDDGTGWSQTAALTASDGFYFDKFGISVDLDGDTLLVGARNQMNSGGVTTGAAYVFDRSGGSWTQTEKFTPTDGAAGDGYGAAVTVSDGLLVIGAPMHDPVAPGGTVAQLSAGSIYAYGPDTPPPPPAVPDTPDLVNLSDTGVSSTDDLTNDNTPTFAGMADANVTIELFAGGVSLGTTVSDGSGAWLFTSGALGDGMHEITAVATNEGGSSAASGTLIIEIDTDAPAITDVVLGGNGRSVVIHVSGLLDQMLAQNGSHYTLLAANGDANGDGDAFNDGDEWQLSVGMVEYDAAAGVIRVPTLEFIEGDQFRLIVDGDDAGSDGQPGVGDAAGNLLAGGDFTADFDVAIPDEPTARDVIDDVTGRMLDLGLNPKQLEKLLDSLNSAKQNLETGGEGPTLDAIKDLESFSRRVEQYARKGHIDGDVAQELIDDAGLAIDMTFLAPFDGHWFEDLAHDVVATDLSAGQTHSLLTRLMEAGECLDSGEPDAELCAIRHLTSVNNRLAKLVEKGAIDAETAGAISDSVQAWVDELWLAPFGDDAIGQLAADVVALRLPVGKTGSLLGELEQAALCLDSGEDGAAACAVTHLRRFGKRVGKLVDKGLIDASSGEAMMSAAQAMIDALRLEPFDEDVFGALAEGVVDLDLKPGKKDRLLAALADAEAALNGDAGELAALRNMVDFTRLMERLAEKGDVDADAAAALIDSAHVLIDDLREGAFPFDDLDDLAQSVSDAELTDKQAQRLLGDLDDAVQVLKTDVRNPDGRGARQVEQFVNRLSKWVERGQVDAAVAQPMIDMANGIIAVLIG